MDILFCTLLDGGRAFSRVVGRVEGWVALPPSLFSPVPSLSPLFLTLSFSYLVLSLCTYIYIGVCAMWTATLRTNTNALWYFIAASMCW